MIDGKATPAYSLTARALHWITAVLILTMLPLGMVIAAKWSGPLKDQLYDLHRSIGAVIIPLMVIRLGYRLMHPPLPMADDIPPIQQLAAHATQERFTYYHSWRVGDLLIWDERATMHRGAGDYHPEERRIMLRTIVYPN